MKGFRRSFVVEGLNLERFLRKLAEGESRITGVIRCDARKMQLTAYESSLPEMIRLAEEGGWQVTIGDRIGAGRLMDQGRKRWILWMCLLTAVVLVSVCSRFMWNVRVINAGAYAAEIEEALLDMGIEPPMPRSHVDLAAVRARLEWRYPRVAWIECGWRGPSLEIRMVEGVLPQDKEQSEIGNVVASRDGVVRQIVTRAGTPAVTVGETVREGQVLIRGEERTADGAVRLVQADGTVLARVWVKAAVQTPLYEIRTEYTGRTCEAWVLESPWFRLWRMPDSEYAHQDVAVSTMPLGGFFLPLTIRWETRMEAAFDRIPRESGAAQAEGATAALRQLAEIAGGKESLVDNWVNWSIIEDEILLSEATGEMLVDIARQERDSGMAATE